VGVRGNATANVGDDGVRSSVFFRSADDRSQNVGGEDMKTLNEIDVLLDKSRYMSDSAIEYVEVNSYNEIEESEPLDDELRTLIKIARAADESVEVNGMTNYLRTTVNEARKAGLFGEVGK
jgi:hypothetical protein